MNEPWEVKPHVGVGPVRFGMSREQVRATISMPSVEFKRTPNSNSSDNFSSIGTFAYYAEGGGLEAIEFSSRVQIVVEGLELTTSPTERLLCEVLSLDPDAEMEAKSSGFISRRLGVGIWTEDERSEPPQSVIVFAPGYYD